MIFSIRKLLLVLLGLGIVSGIAYSFLPKPVPVDMAHVKRGSLLVTVDEDGKTRIKDKYIVSAPLQGHLLRIDLEPGDFVPIGKTLAVIEPTAPELLDARARAESKARVEAAKASKRQAQAQFLRAQKAYTKAKSHMDRIHPLFLSGNYSEENYEESQHNVKILQQELKAVEFAVQVADHQLALAEAAFLRTEPNGVSSSKDHAFKIDFQIAEEVKVLRVFQESARVVTPGTQLIELGNPTNLEVEIDVLSQDAVKITKGAKVFLEEWGGEHALPGRVRLVEPAAFLKVSALGVEEQRVNVIIDFDFPSAKEHMKALSSLGDAFRIVARIVVWEGKDVVKVPAGSLFRHEGGWAVFAVVVGVAELRPVEVGHTNGLETEIRSGLQEGERVILNPSDKILPGVEVYPREKL